MNKRWLIALLILAFLIVIALAVPLLLWWTIAREPKVEYGTVLEIDLGGLMTEGPPADPISALFAQQPSIYELRQMLEYAARDKRIAGAFVKVRPLENGWASVEELRAAIKDFRRSGKKVYALLGGDFVEDKEYLLSTAADKIYVNPDISIMVNGLLAEIEFFRGTLEKLRIEPQFLQFKEYKAAAEPWSRRNMSEPFREMLNSILSDSQQRFLQLVAEERELQVDRIKNLLDIGLITAEQAKAEGLVDALGYKDNIEQELTPQGKEYRGLGAASYLRSVRDRLEKGGRNKLALIFANGLIIAGESQPSMEMMGGETVAGYIRQARKDKSIKAVVMRVNSPGGSAVGSDLVWREVELTSKEKPVIVSMSDVAGSGGYYISMAADKIIAHPTTITGSIGVVFGKFNVRGFFNWIGTNIDRVETAPNAGLLSPYTSMDSRQMAQLEKVMGDLYRQFVSKAAQGRKLPPDKLESIAKGRVWTGRQAKELGLIDELGGLDLALRTAKERSGIKPDEPVTLIIYPRRKGLLELLFQRDLPLSRISRTSLPAWIERLEALLEQPQPWLLAPQFNIR